MFKHNGFEAEYLPEGWKEKDFPKFVSISAGVQWLINQWKMGNGKFKIPTPLIQPMTVFKREGLNGYVKYNVYHDGSFLLESNAVDEVWFQVGDFILDTPEILDSKFKHDIDLLNFYTK